MPLSCAEYLDNPLCVSSTVPRVSAAAHGRREVHKDGRSGQRLREEPRPQASVVPQT